MPCKTETATQSTGPTDAEALVKTLIAGGYLLCQSWHQ